MISVDKLLDMVCTESIEATAGDHFYRKDSEGSGLPLVCYETELIRNPDGSLVWVD